MLSKEEQTTRKSYNGMASAWASTLSEDFWKQHYKKFKKFLSSGKIVDLGCGNGRDAYWLSNMGYKVVGVDISKEMVRLSKVKNPELEFFVKSFYELDFAKKSFEGFWAANSLLHIPKRNIAGVLKNIAFILKSGAIGFISLKEGNGEKMTEWRQSGYKRYFIYYRQDEFAKILKQNGFEILTMQKKSPANNNQDGTFLIFYVKLITK
jgi:SAM-dependent methyltransferase